MNGVEEEELKIAIENESKIMALFVKKMNSGFTFFIEKKKIDRAPIIIAFLRFYDLNFVIAEGG